MIIKVGAENRERYIKNGKRIEKWYVHKEEDGIVWLQKVLLFNPDLPVLKLPKSQVFDKKWKVK